MLWAVTRDVTRLDGARGKKQVCRPCVRAWGISESNVLYWRKYLWHCWGFRVPQWFSARGIVSPLHPSLCPGCYVHCLKYLNRNIKSNSALIPPKNDGTSQTLLGRKLLPIALVFNCTTNIYACVLSKSAERPANKCPLPGAFVCKQE